MASRRIEWLDIAKGIGILLVVAGHCIKLTHPICQLIFVFHMPLFFMLSGYTFSTKDGFFKTLGKKTKTLLVPYAAFFLLGLAVTLLLPMWQHRFTLSGLKADFWLADPANVHNSSIWFLVCLFFVVLVYWVLNKMPIWVQVPLILALFVLGIWYAAIRNDVPIMGYARLPFNLDVVPAGLLFYALGFYARRYRLFEKIESRWWIELLVTVVGVVGTVLVYQKNGYVNTHGLQFGQPHLYVLGGVLGSMAVIGVSMLIARFRKEVFADFKRVLMWYGRNSLYVLGFQSLLIRLYVVLFNTYKHTQLGMYAFPWSHAINCTILVAFIAVPLLVLALNATKRGGRKLKERITAGRGD